MLFEFRVRDECIVSVTITGQRYARVLLAPRAKQEVDHNVLTATIVVMVNGSSLSTNQRKKRTMCQLTFHQQLLNTKLSLVLLKRAVMLLVMGVVTPLVL
jgi:hypothetical protein